VCVCVCLSVCVFNRVSARLIGLEFENVVESKVSLFSQSLPEVCDSFLMSNFNFYLYPLPLFKSFLL